MTNFYKNKKVVVTGGAGMVGSHLVEKLIELGASVTVVDNMSRGKFIPKGIGTYKMDASNYIGMLFALRDAFALFNLAATVAGVNYNQKNNLYMFDNNIKLASVPIRAANDMKTPHVLQVSSVCVYPDGETDPCDDTLLKWGDPNFANAGYAEAKRDGERAARWSSLEHAVIVRPTNIYGPRDYFDDRAHVIPALIKKILVATESGSDSIEVYGTGEEMREFIYVADVVDAMLFAMEYGDNKEVYNIGTGGRTCVTISALLKLLQDIIGTNLEVVYSDRYSSGDNKRWTKTEKINDLGWSYQITLQEGLEKVVDWKIDSDLENVLEKWETEMRNNET